MIEPFHIEYESTNQLDPNSAFIMNSNNQTFLGTNNSYENFTRYSDMIVDKSLLSFLLDNEPDFVSHVPEHWLIQQIPSYKVRYYVAMAFLIICLPANIGHLITFVAFGRY